MLHSLFDLLKFRPQGKYLNFTSQSARMLWVKRHTGQIMPNAEPHQVVAREMLASQSIPVMMSYYLQGYIHHSLSVIF
jgi:hypothetical protein